MSTYSCLLCYRYFVILDGQYGFATALAICDGCAKAPKEVKDGKEKKA